MCGRIFSDNLQFCARKGNIRCHILDTFDIHVDIKLKKEDAAAASKLHDEDTALSVELAVNLMKLNVDDLKLISMPIAPFRPCTSCAIRVEAEHGPR